jgi:putative flippase GtrA
LVWGTEEVDVIRDFYSRFRELIHEVAKFGLVGVLAFVVTFVGTNLLISDGRMSPVAATTIATVVATVFSFYGNRHWAFKHRRGSKGLGHEGLLFLIFNGVGLAIQVGAVAIVQHGMGRTDRLSVNVALVIGVGVATLFRLYSYRRWVFLKAPAAESATGTEHLEPETSGR